MQTCFRQLKPWISWMIFFTPSSFVFYFRLKGESNPSLLYTDYNVLANQYMMDSTICAQCGIAAEGMQHCGGCHTVKYCSCDCQRQHWRGGHKHECARLDRPSPTASSSSAGPGSAPDNPLSTRTTFRMNLADMMRMYDPGNPCAERLPQRETDPADTIYYLMTAIEGINDRTLFGPFHTREAFVPSLFSKVSSCAPLAVPGLEEYLSVAGLDAFTYYRSPLLVVRVESLEPPAPLK